MRRAIRMLTLTAAALMTACATDQARPGADPPIAHECREITARDYRVVRVIDGDTFVVIYDGEPTSCRLAGVNAPEIRDKGGIDSRQALAELLKDARGEVEIRFPARRKRDHFGRLLVAVTVRGRDVGSAMIALGQATARPID